MPGVEGQLGQPERRSAGSISAGLTTMVLPVASAGPTFHDVMAMGKFHGTMAATTPSGSWKVMSTPPATGTVAPRCLSTAPA